MEDDVEVELELEKQLSLAHEMFWQIRTPYGEKELLNNFRQRKLNNFEEDEFPKKQSDLCFSSSLLPCSNLRNFVNANLLNLKPVCAFLLLKYVTH